MFCNYTYNQSIKMNEARFEKKTSHDNIKQKEHEN